MIAPIQQPEACCRSAEMRRAHRLVASSLLTERSYPADGVPPVRRWKAWLFTGWVVVVTGVYFAYMIGVL